MKLTKTKLNTLLILTLAFHISSSEASGDEALRILVVGVRGQSRFSAADLLSGRKDGGQEDREIVKTPVITDGARRMMLVTGPNLCEEDTERQTFTTALFLSSPGPYAVLMVLNLEDQQSQQCDIEKRAQELLGAEVLQYCIVLLLQKSPGTFDRSLQRDCWRNDQPGVTLSVGFATVFALFGLKMSKVLNLEDQQSQQCDIEKRAQELLGAEVLQYCIVSSAPKSPGTFDRSLQEGLLEK
ncbi:GTPase IMAP family member 6-like [Cyprinus carpio]|uniref:GTPase IMAP family member 6-like n=1 Tax=Cyprinus carpio TaxID=7962 RepID=A0A9Q9XVF4_CYPCA|nr:GTPase IMAP family member 6-like [Cyprinus carpio]